ncbi:hypothetical protein M0R72_06850 [Candidatus Pacearchaeota archaeon]|jgi:hypothetical protein|nr:hypothetical protein [Candidatus Pacearchaeota archaeon]
MVTQEAINMIMSGKHSEKIVAEEDDDYSEKLQRAAVSCEVPEWVRRASQRIIESSMRQNIPVDRVSFDSVGLGLHDNIVEAAIIGCESERFFKIVMNFEEAIENMRGF